MSAPLQRRQLLRHCVYPLSHRTSPTVVRPFSVTRCPQNEAPAEASSFVPSVDPSLVTFPYLEKKLLKSGIKPVGSRRRRAALRSTGTLPFEQLPYQCFQEARKVLQADRDEKIQMIGEERARIAKLEAKEVPSGQAQIDKTSRLYGMRRYLEKLKILADINDPMIRKRFEDGLGDLDRPIYRHLAKKEWRSYRRPVLMQRITQMAVVPDILPLLDPVAEVQLAFNRRKVHPGDFVDAVVSEEPPKLRVQVFDKGEKLVSMAIVDLDVPDLENDDFNSRCHFLACNIPVSPTSGSIPLTKLSPETQTLFPWLPPYAQKGSPYHRLAVVILRQADDAALDAAAVRNSLQRNGFKLRGLASRFRLQAIGAHLFRSRWDEGTSGVMYRAGIPGADVELRRKPVEPLKTPQLPLKRKKNRLGLAGLPRKRL
ncbi:MAG: hypothetical protein M1833_003768 [Piccolia ochrophora]|nr:MAG: hypothetical protein M1833_003768 [Piccolia ochrophora]